MTRCPECPRVGSPIPACGPTPCPILFLGAKPGKVEAKTGQPYTGKAGEELDRTYLRRAGLQRDDVAVGNMVLCYDGKDDQPSDKLVESCARHHLPALLRRVQPDVVVLMGGPPNRLARLLDTGGPVRLEMHRGRPMACEIAAGEWQGVVWPSYEPALGMRDTGKMTQLLEDFGHLGQWLEGEWSPPSPDEVLGTTGGKRGRDYQIINNCRQLYGYLQHYHPSGYVPGVDTEKHGKEPFSVQVSTYPNSGRFIKAEDRASLQVLRDWCLRWEIALHNASGDLDLIEGLKGMGIKVPQWRDTMQEAFQLCSLPQGLKPLAYRLFGVTMRSWEDVVRPASVAALVDWMERAHVLAQDHLCVEKKLKTKVKLLPGTVEGIMKHVLAQVAKTEDAEKPYDPWKGLEKFFSEGLRGKKPEAWELEWLECEAESGLGPRPILGIGNCRLEDAAEYAIGDADWTGQTAVELARLRQGSEWDIREGDQDQ